MSLAWHAIYDHLFHSSTTLTFHRHFDLFRQNEASIAPFRDPAALLDALHSKSGRADDKSECLKALAREAVRSGPASDTALTLLLLALWPGLDAIRRRAMRRRLGSEPDVASDILARATEVLRGLELSQVNWVAATTLMNVERDMLRGCRSETGRQRATSSTLPDDIPDERELGGSQLSSALLHADLGRIVGADATLVIRVAVEGFTQAEVAAEFGLSGEAARKRYQRAVSRLRKALEKND